MSNDLENSQRELNVSSIWTLKLLILTLSYAMIKVTNASLDATMSSILATLEMPQQAAGYLLAVGTGCYLVSKFVGSPVTDIVSPRLALMVSLGLSGIGIVMLSLSQSYLFVLLSWAAYRATSAVVWPAVVVGGKGIGAKGFGVMALGGRAGQMLGGFCVGMALVGGFQWRTIMGLMGLSACLLGATAYKVVVPVKVESRTGKDESRTGKEGKSVEDQDSSSNSHHPLVGKSSKQALLYFVQKRSFWLLISAQLALCAIMEMQSFLPLQLKETLKLSPGKAAMSASVFQVGGMLGLYVTGQLYDNLSPKHRFQYVIGTLGTCTLATICLWQFNWELMMNLTLIFIVGFCVCPAYTIPAALFSSKEGGPFAGTLSGLIDAIAYISAMSFNLSGAYIADMYGWNAVFGIVSVMGAIAFCGMGYLHYDDMKVREALPS